MTTDKVKPCLWFNDQAEEAANFHISLFPNSRLGKSRVTVKVRRYRREPR